MRFRKIFSVVVLCNLLYFPIYYFLLLPNDNQFWANAANSLIRLIGGCAIGIWAAYRYRADPVSPKKSIAIAVIAGLFGAYYVLLSFKLYIFLIDLVWYGIESGPHRMSYPIRIFICDSIFDKWAVAGHMCLIATYQIAKLFFARRRSTYIP